LRNRESSGAIFAVSFVLGRGYCRDRILSSRAQDE